MAASVKQHTMFVGSDGRWVEPGTADFAAALGNPGPSPGPGVDLEAFAVETLGFVKFQIVERSIVEIELHLGRVQLPALLAVQQQLLSSDVRLFRIKYFDTSWHSEISSSAEKTISRLVDLCAPQFSPKGHKRFQLEALDFNVLLDDYDHQMRPLAQKWRVSFAVFDPSIITLAMRSRLLARMVIVGVKPRQHDPVWRFIGDGHRWIGGKHYVHSGLGDKVTNIPDKEYGEWASQYYQLVAETGRPIYDLVSTAIQYHHNAAKPSRQIRYERLLLPWRTPSDEVFVTMCTKLVAGVPGSAAAATGDAPGGATVTKLAISS